MDVYADGLVEETGDGPRLIGSRCRVCAAVEFPAQGACRQCAGQDVAREVLCASGTVWSWTVQRFPLPAPYVGDEADVPFALGYVELPGQVRVQAVLRVAPDAVHIGMPVSLVVERGPHGATFAFAEIAA